MYTHVRSRMSLSYRLAFSSFLVLIHQIHNGEDMVCNGDAWYVSELHVCNPCFAGINRAEIAVTVEDAGEY